MKRITIVLSIVAVLAGGGALALVLSGAQQSPAPVTLESLQALFVTAEGQNRLDLIDQKIEDLDKEVDYLYQLELSVQQDIAAGAEKQEWTLSYIVFLLQEIKQRLNDIDDQVHL